MTWQEEEGLEGRWSVRETGEGNEGCTGQHTLYPDENVMKLNTS